MRAFSCNSEAFQIAAFWRVARLGFASAAWSALVAVSAARAEIKATDCSIAISGTTAFSSQTIHCLSEDQIGRVIEVLVKRGVILRAEDAGLGIATVRTLAKRLKPTQQLDDVQAAVELSHAVDVALSLVAQGAQPSGDALIDETLRQVAERTKANDAAGATRAAEAGFAQWEKEESERRTSALARGLKLLEAALQTDLLRFDAEAAAQRIEKIVSLEHANDPKAMFAALRRRRDQFYEEGDEKGVNFSLQVAIAIARHEVSLARGADERGMALNDLGTALGTLGHRESGTDKLNEAVAAFREALKENTRDRAPLQWARTQMNLGNALRMLGERESGTDKLNKAVAAFREALKENTRDRAPLQWAKTQMNLGTALATLGERESETDKLNEAVAAYREALKERTRDRAPLDWAMTQVGLGAAFQTLGERESGTDKLTEAVAAYREALKENTRDRVPLEWAMTQMNLGNALLRLGDRESGTDKLNEAVAAYREALKEYTRDRVPLDWARTTGNQGVALMRLAERQKDAQTAATALRQIDAARDVMRAGGHAPDAAYYESSLLEARALVDRLKTQGRKSK
jgi:tetratricopeptide (TPR) repeat protein